MKFNQRFHAYLSLSHPYLKRNVCYQKADLVMGIIVAIIFHLYFKDKAAVALVNITS